MTMSRRDFISSSGVALATLTFARYRTSTTLRVATVVDARYTDLESGLAFGASEADRSAGLFGWHIERLSVGSGQLPAGSVSCDALIVGARVDGLPPNVPILVATCDRITDSSNVFRLTSCSEDASSREPGRHTVLWHESLKRFGAEQLNDRYRSATHVGMNGDSWVGWFAMKLIAEAALRARSTEPRKILAYLGDPAAQFDGHKGVSLRFDSRRRLLQPTYVVERRGDGSWNVAEEIAPASARRSQ